MADPRSAVPLSSAPSCRPCHVVIGETHSIAREKAEYLDSLIDPGAGDGLVVELARRGSQPLDTAEQAESQPATRASQGSRDRMSQVTKAQNISFAEASASRAACWPARPP